MWKSLSHLSKQENILFLVLYALFFIPFWKPIIIGLIIGSGLNPLVSYFSLKLKITRRKSRYIVSTTIVFIFLLFFFGAIAQVISMIDNYKDQPDLIEKVKTVSAQLQHQVLVVSKEYFPTTSKASQFVDHLSQQVIEGGSAMIAHFVPNLVVTLPDLLLKVFIFFAVATFLAADGGQGIIQFFMRLGFDPGIKKDWRDFETVCARSLGSQVLIGTIQAAVITLGAGIAGASNLVLIYIVSFFLSAIPFVGILFVPLIVAVILFLEGNTSAILIMIITACVASIVENGLRALFFSRLSHANVIFSFFAILGSLIIFGIAGIFLAPVVEQLAMQVWNQMHGGKAQETASA